MTRKEWVKENKPNFVDELCLCGVFGCPENGFYPESPFGERVKCEKRCADCWNEEISEVEEK